MSGQVIDDPVFGPIVFDVLWETREPVLLFERAVRVSIEGDIESGPDDRQRERYCQFLTKRSDLRDELQEAIFAYYQRVCAEYREAMDEDEADEYAPILTSSEEIWNRVEPTSIHLPLQTPDMIDNLEFDFCIEWETTWDEEHGLQTGYRDWKISVVDLPRY